MLCAEVRCALSRVSSFILPTRSTKSWSIISGAPPGRSSQGRDWPGVRFSILGLSGEGLGMWNELMILSPFYRYFGYVQDVLCQLFDDWAR